MQFRPSSSCRFSFTRYSAAYRLFFVFRYTEIRYDSVASYRLRKFQSYSRLVQQFPNCVDSKRISSLNLHKKGHKIITNKKTRFQSFRRMSVNWRSKNWLGKFQGSLRRSPGVRPIQTILIRSTCDTSNITEFHGSNGPATCSRKILATISAESRRFSQNSTKNSCKILSMIFI